MLAPAVREGPGGGPRPAGHYRLGQQSPPAYQTPNSVDSFPEVSPVI